MNQKNKQYRIGLIALALISLHIVLCLYLVFSPAKLQIKNRVGVAYRQLVLLGPFFAESRIKSTRYLTIRYKQNATWSAFQDLSREHAAAYRSRPWRWDMLACIGYETYLIRAVGDRPIDTIKKTPAFRELNAFLKDQFIPASCDSVQIIAHAATYLPESHTVQSDTIFDVTYNPELIGEAKK